MPEDIAGHPVALVINTEPARNVAWEGYGGGPLWKRMPALCCVANEEEEQDKIKLLDVNEVPVNGGDMS